MSLLLKTSKVHGFGVNAMDAVRTSESEFLVVTGGDDQHIVAALYQASDQGAAMVDSVRIYAHSSCIKGLVIQKHEGVIGVHSSGYD